MLPARHRFSLRKDPTFFARTRRKSTPFLLAYYQEAPSFSAAVIISKKVAPSAVDRHRFKRHIHELVQKHALQELLTIVIVAKKNVVDLSYSDLEVELLQLLSHIKLSTTKQAS